MPIQKKIPSLEEVEALINDATENFKDSIKNPTALSSEDLNTLYGDSKLGYYFGGGGNSCGNKPEGASAFGLFVVKTASGNYSQLMFAGKNNYYDLMKRDYISGSWGEWSYVTDRNKLNISVSCDHEYEITGKTGHEYAVAIPDGQVLIKRINGQTRRKSLNLIDGFYCETSATSQYASSFKCTKLDVSVGKQYTINFKTVNTGAELYVNENLFSFKSFRCDGREYTFVFTCQNIADKFIIFKNTIDNTGRFDSMPVYNIQILEGDYTNKDIPTYQDYDDTLVNSKCNLISSGRNLIDINKLIEGRNAKGLTSTYKDGYTYTTTINSDTRVWGYSSAELYMTLPAGTYKIVGQWGSSTTNNAVQIYDSNNQLIKSIGNSTSITSNSFTLSQLTEVGIITKSYNTSLSLSLYYGTDHDNSFEPYEESSMLVDKELGEFDYIDNVSHLLVKQTSNIITLDGSSDENWAVVDSQSSGNTNLFRWVRFTGEQVEGNAGVSNIFGEANESVWGNDEKCFGIASGDRVVLIRVSKEECPDVNSFRTWLSNHSFQFVYKKTTPTTEPIQLEAGYQVWNSGLQIQETETLPYVLEKEYAVSLYSQILAVTSIVNSIPDDVVSKSWVEQTYIKKDAFSIDEDGKLIIDI